MKVQLYNSSARGTGQFVRSIKLARLIAEAVDGSVVEILAGNCIVPKELPPRTKIVALPQIHKSLRGEYVTDGESVESAFRRRSTAISEAVWKFDPDYFFVDSRPLGLRDELRDVLGQLSGTKCRSILLLRDIVDDSQIVRNQWREAKWYQAVQALYQQVLVLGERDLYDAVAEYEFSNFDHKVHHIGYLDGGWSSQDTLEPKLSSTARKNILVTVGGGFDGDSVIQVVWKHIQQNNDQFAHLDYTIVLGMNSSLSEHALRSVLPNVAKKVTVYKHVSDMTSLFVKSDVIVSMGGYNTLTELVYLKKKVIVVPRAHAGREQAIRAQLFAKACDGIWAAYPLAFTTAALASLLEQALLAPSPTASFPFNARLNFLSFVRRQELT